MRKIITLIFLVITLSGFSQLILDTEEIIPNKVYCIHSRIDSSNVTVNTVNIYAFKGSNDTVVLFGAGYGDKSDSVQSDLAFYKPNWDATRNAIDDAREVDSVITNIFNISMEDAKLVFIAQHFHLDHFNYEIFAAFITLGYDINQMEAFVHISDYSSAICNSPYCGNNPSPEFRGAPFQPSWTQDVLDIIHPLGSYNDICNTWLHTYGSDYGGIHILKGDTLHTPGQLTIDIKGGYYYRFVGARLDSCDCSKQDWSIFYPHGNAGISQTMVNIDELVLPDVNLYPNPSMNNVTIEFDGQGELIVMNTLGQTVKKVMIEPPYTFKRESLPDGLYLFNIIIDSKIITRKIIFY